MKGRIDQPVSSMERIVSLISRLRAMIATTSTFQRKKAAEFVASMNNVVSQLTVSEGETAAIMSLRDILVLAESVSAGGGVAKEKTIKALDIVLLQLSDIFNSSKLLSDTAISWELDSIERMIDASEVTVMQYAVSCDMPTNTISLDDLQQENFFSPGTKQQKMESWYMLRCLISCHDGTGHWR